MQMQLAFDSKIDSNDPDFPPTFARFHARRNRLQPSVDVRRKLIVVQKVAGSNPVARPRNYRYEGCAKSRKLETRRPLTATLTATGAFITTRLHVHSIQYPPKQPFHLAQRLRAGRHVFVLIYSNSRLHIRMSEHSLRIFYRNVEFL